MKSAVAKSAVAKSAVVGSDVAKSAVVASGVVKQSFFTRLWLSPVRFYRRYLSPLKGRPTCRYLPTCSEYAIEAVEHHGVFVGSFKAAWRLLRCNPLFAGGYDPVCHQGKCKE